jgi:hypothetical protein
LLPTAREVGMRTFFRRETLPNEAMGASQRVHLGLTTRIVNNI